MKIDKLTERVGLAYQTVTNGDLAKLHADLPPSTRKASATRVGTGRARQAQLLRRPARR